MKSRVLVDAGPLIALLNNADPDHERCAAAIRRIRGALLTTWMPITEAMHFLAFSAKARDTLLEMIERGTLQILPIGKEDLASVRSLMAKYADLGMDFADATLVCVAIRERLRTIFTLDRRDFSVYRLGPRRSFSIIPE